MALENSDIEKLATLARININDEMKTEVAGKISDILTMIDDMQALDTSGIEPMANSLDATQRLREDIVTESNKREQLQAVAPATEDGLYLVPKVID
ncbi:MAG: aspartyl-tRNA(Asn)/glutamyl-tRNA(Gln) amidotransferase subunit C [Chitinophagales bacterium]|jgi:aspartyl-tRNA(Asn)/glutamyl-tRNA(Gln) amidotransferase subunit C